MDAIIRTADPTQVALKDNPSIVPDDRNLTRYPTWSHGEPQSLKDHIKNFKKAWDFFLIETEKDFSQGTHLQILGHSPNSIAFDKDKPSIEKIKVPFVEGMYNDCTD